MLLTTTASLLTALSNSEPSLKFRNYFLIENIRLHIEEVLD